jgi:hypothetical protein
MLLCYLVCDKQHINTAVLYITHSQEMYFLNIVGHGYLGLQPYKILAILCTATLFSHTVILCVVCGFTVLYAALTNGFYHQERKVFTVLYEFKLGLMKYLRSQFYRYINYLPSLLSHIYMITTIKFIIYDAKNIYCTQWLNYASA